MARNTNPTTYDKVKSYVDSSEGYVVLTRELLPFGSRSGVEMALKRLNDEWYLRRISIGVYAKTKWDKHHNRRFITAPLSTLAYEALIKLSYKVMPGKAYRNYCSGISTQVPCRIIFDTMGKNVRRTFVFGKLNVYYENDVKRVRD